MQIRPFESIDSDYSAILAINKILHPEEQVTVEMRREEDVLFSAENDLTRILGEIDNQIIAHGSYWHPSEADEPPQFSYVVHPDYQSSDAPALMQSYLLAKLEEASPATMVSEALESEKYRTQLIEEAGFTLKMRFPRSQLDVKRVDFSAYEDLEATLVQQRIEFITLTDVMQRDSNWKRHVWKMFNIIDQDVPYPDPQESVPFEAYSEFYEGDLFRPNSWAIALDQSLEGEKQYVGMAVVNIMPTRPDTVYAGITGVIPSHRRRKIATILKVHSFKYAQAAGFDFIYTDNEENNPMYDLNLQLGFQPLPAYLYYQK